MTRGAWNKWTALPVLILIGVTWVVAIPAPAPNPTDEARGRSHSPRSRKPLRNASPPVDVAIANRPLAVSADRPTHAPMP